MSPVESHALHRPIPRGNRGVFILSSPPKEYGVGLAFKTRSLAYSLKVNRRLKTLTCTQAKKIVFLGVIGYCTKVRAVLAGYFLNFGFRSILSPSYELIARVHSGNYLLHCQN